MQPSRETINVPVKRHVYKFIAKQMNDSPIEVTNRTTIGTWLAAILRRQKDDAQYKSVISSYPDHYPISLSSKQVFHLGCRHLTSLTVVQFNSFFDNEIKRELFTHVSYSVRLRNTPQKSAILEFMEIYGFEDSDISFDALKKSLQRIGSRNAAKSPLLWVHN